MADNFCPQCGAARTGAFRFCRGCGFDFDTDQPGRPKRPIAMRSSSPTTAAKAPPPPKDAAEPAAASTAPTGTPMVVTLAGLAWIGAALLTGYLAYLQLSVGSILPGQGYQELALWNGVSAAVTLYFGARLLTRPDRDWLKWSIYWAILNVAWGGYQASQGATTDVFMLSLVLSGAAGILSFAARDQVET